MIKGKMLYHNNFQRIQIYFYRLFFIKKKTVILRLKDFQFKFNYQL